MKNKKIEMIQVGPLASLMVETEETKPVDVSPSDETHIDTDATLALSSVIEASAEAKVNNESETATLAVSYVAAEHEAGVSCVKLGELYAKWLELTGTALDAIISLIIAANLARYGRIGEVDQPIPLNGSTRQRLVAAIYWPFPTLLSTLKKGGDESLASVKFGVALRMFKARQKADEQAKNFADSAALSKAIGHALDPEPEKAKVDAKAVRFNAKQFTAMYASASTEQRDMLYRVAVNAFGDVTAVNKAVKSWFGEQVVTESGEETASE